MNARICSVMLCLAITAGCTAQNADNETKETRPTQSLVAEQTVVPGQSQPATPQEAAGPLTETRELAATADQVRVKGKTLGAESLAGAVPAARMILPAPLAPSPAWNTESYNPVRETGFINAGRDPLSTFSIDVDTAGYANVRRFVQGGSLPPAGAVRIEEMVNYFSYDYPKPTGRNPFALSAEVGPSPFHPGYQLARIGLAARDLAREQLPPSNLVFLVDVSGSMDAPNKLPLLQQALHLLIDQLGERDRVALVVYAGADRVVLPPTAAHRREAIRAAIDQLRTGGSTHASSGIRTAYELARQSFLPGGNNRVILASDGDFNVGVTSRDELQRLIEREREGGVYLTVLGFGMGNYHDDTMEVLADKGNGNYAYIDSLLEARKVLVKEMSGTLFTLAGDVKIQVEFNPARIGAYRLIGYENRALADEDFRDDAKDAGEIGVGHRVTALYELIPAGHAAIPQLDPLKYQAVQPAKATGAHELMIVKLRYKPRGEQASRQMSLAVAEARGKQMTTDFRLAAAVAGFGMLLTGSEHLGSFTWEQCLEMARTSRGEDAEGYRAEFVRLVEMSQLLARRHTPQPEPAPDQSPRPFSLQQPMLR